MTAASSMAVRAGQRHLRPALPDEPSRLVSDWLGEHGVALNMRCGGRGQCRGCLVEVAGLSRPIRACQTICGDLPAGAESMTIPPASLADHSLHGVSDFEVRGATTRPKLRPGLGLALDIGTTTVAGALWNLADGTCLATASRGNAQRRHGDDVVSRISFAVEDEDGAARLQLALVADTLAPLIEVLASEAGVKPGQIAEAVVAGNPTMLHTLTGESLVGFATYPFRPVFLGARVLSAADLGLPLGGRVQLLPGLGPFVGADIVAGALASGMLEDDRGCILLVDFGTNGEILLRTPEGCLAAAAAAGPAFEGGRLRHGATARAGVVSSMRIGEEGWMLDVIGGGTAPHGISGAAYVDFLAQAWGEGLLDARGRFNPDRPEVRAGEPGGNTGRLVEVAAGLDVSESDVAELLQAKAAIAGGVATLMEMAGIRGADLSAVLIAGGFGYNLDVGHALAIGLLPEVPPERVDLIGNASLGGASLILQAGQPATLDRLLKHTRVIELNQVPSFEDHFTGKLFLGGHGSV